MITEYIQLNHGIVKNFKGRTPASSYHREAKEQALIRDGFRCVVTGKYDVKGEDLSIVTLTEVLDAGGIVNTECAHIIPDSVYFNISAKTDTDTSAEKDYSSSALAVLKHFGYNIESLNGEKFHSLFNVMTMEKDVHDWFDRLQMWFEKTVSCRLDSWILVLGHCIYTQPSLNCYRVCTARRGYVVPHTVTFTSSDPINLPLPSGELPALHAACAKVANLSGAAKWLDKIADDKDNLETLAPDGSSSNVLNHAIWENLGPL
ncbi:hypothetical protein SERLA73DRAFT_176352 [Serpula lacrymans var. lacrymans S7.3]|uniref:HNH nuclease domain-containing protein n=1 Tax=Serpula lacrymans var. lacrymans (strain S7.3) TaxID=936435 RepID=F8PMR3_SERL3|nr:hypothetical protein SERLA73DRAFT_176352 [Serpula lacrymans var. lacrymans S7.3]